MGSPGIIHDRMSDCHPVSWSIGCMDYLTTESSFDSHSMWVIVVLGLYLGLLYMGCVQPGRKRCVKCSYWIGKIIRSVRLRYKFYFILFILYISITIRHKYPFINIFLELGAHLVRAPMICDQDWYTVIPIFTLKILLANHFPLLFTYFYDISVNVYILPY